MTPETRRTGAGPEVGPEVGLEPFFAAARGHAAPEPSIALLSTILADAAEVHAARAPAPAPIRATPPPRRFAFAGLLARWPAVATLGACALLGFWIGFDGLSGFGLDATRTAANTESASTQTTADALGDFYDMAALTR